MGLLIDGIWKDRWYETEKTGGKFVRQESTFRNLSYRFDSLSLDNISPLRCPISPHAQVREATSLNRQIRC